jgi:DNA polymerase III subunit delta
MLFLLHGSETFLRRQRVKELKREAAGKGAVIEEIDCAEVNLEEVFCQLNTSSLFHTAKIFFLREPFGLPEWADKEVQKILLKTTHTLVFIAGEVKKTDPLFIFLSRNGTLQEFLHLKGAQLKRQIAKECKMRELRLDPEAEDLLMFACADNLERLSQEIAKLAAFKRFSSQKTASKQDVLSLVAQRTEPKIFSTIDAISAKNRILATKLLAEHIAAGEAPLQLLGMFAWHIRTLLSIKDLEERGMGQGDIARKLKLHPFMAQKSFIATKRFSLQELKELYRRLFALDLALKTSKGNQEQLLYLFVGQAAGKENQR